MQIPLVSINIPVHNGERTLRECLRAVLNQTYKNYEIIIVDNNSTDKTKNILEEFQKKNKKIKYIFERKIGRGAARNAGIKNSSGEIIAMTDSDCIVPQNWIKEITEPIRSGKEMTVMGSEESIIDNYWTKNIQKANKNLIKSSLDGRYVCHLDTKNFAINSSLIKKRKFDVNLLALEDFELYLRLKKYSKILFLQDIKVKHNHKQKGKDWFKTQMDRGYWCYKIKGLHPEENKEYMLESTTFMNLIKFPVWLCLQLIKKPI